MTRGIKNIESYTFSHKTFQELFAALWLAVNYRDQKTNLYQRVTTTDSVLEYSILIQFLCGLCPEALTEFWPYIVEDIIEKDESIREWRTANTIDKMQDDDVQCRLQNLLLKCTQEASNCNDLKSDHINYISDIVIAKNISAENIKLLSNIMENYSCKIKSLIVKDISNVENLCRAVVVATELQRLELLLLPTVESNSSDYIPILSLRKQQNLEVLKLEGSFERRLVCLRLPNPKRARLQILRRLVCLQLINPETVQLRIITLRNLTMRYVETEQLFKSLSSYSRLEQLTFDDLRCCDRDCLPVVDLRKHHHLRDLQLKKLSVEGLLIPNQQDTAMRVLRLHSVKMTHNDIQSLYVSLPSSSALENLGLINLSCSDHSDRDCLLPVLNLQKHHNLEKLILEKLSVECLLIPNQQDTEMRTLRLDSVKMTHHDIQSLCVSLSS